MIFQNSPESIAVLRRQMAMVPEGTSLVRNVEVVQEKIPWRDRTLCNKRRAIGPIGTLLEESVPVLEEINEQTKSEKTKRCFYNRCLG